MAEDRACPTAAAARYLGIAGRVPPDVASRIRDLYRTLKTTATPRSAWKIFGVEVKGGSVIVDGAFSLDGKSLTMLLRGSAKAVLMAVTLGAAVDKQINRLQAAAMDDAVILDACASAETEAFCDRVEGEVAATLGKGNFLTMRYSPGYGDVPLTESEKIISALGAGKSLGLTTTKSGMLFPTKSITAIIGITDKKQAREGQCAQCGIKASCLYKKRGDICGL